MANSFISQGLSLNFRVKRNKKTLCRWKCQLVLDNQGLWQNILFFPAQSKGSRDSRNCWTSTCTWLKILFTPSQNEQDRNLKSKMLSRCTLTRSSHCFLKKEYVRCYIRCSIKNKISLWGMIRSKLEAFEMGKKKYTITLQYLNAYHQKKWDIFQLKKKRLFFSTHVSTFAYACIAAGQAIPLLSVSV